MLRFAAALLTFGLATAALAQNTPATPNPPPPAGGSRIAGQLREACAADAQKYCPDLGPGPERRACMREHLAQLTPACKDALAQARAAVGAARGSGN